MIAVFTRSERDFRELKLSPSNNFIRVIGTHSLHGRIFNGVIQVIGWYDSNDEIRDAFDIIQLRQPELFK